MENSAKTAQSIVGTSAGRNKADFYPTPSDATEALLKNEEFLGITWEPACGNGAMSLVLQNKGLNVKSSDLYDRGFGSSNVDFLKTTIYVNNIITNPPFSLAEEFVIHGLECASDKVCLLLKLAFLEGRKRKKMFETTPLRTVYVFSYRLKMTREGVSMKNGGMMAFAWFVWDKKYNGLPYIKWI